MAIALVASETFGFADGNGGHACVFPTGAPAVDDLDVLCVNSNTVVTTPSGFSLRVNATNSQGAYIYTRKATGGESDTVTVTTSGDHNTQVTWSRWSGTDTYSAGNFVRADNSNNTVLPATATGALAATGMLVLAFGALHNHDGALATAPLWSNGFAELETVTQGSAGSSSSVAGLTGYKLNAGTGSETIDSVAWTNAVRNRYALWIAVTAASAGEPVDFGRASELDTAAPLGRSKSRPIGTAAEVDTAAVLTRSKIRALVAAGEVDTAAVLVRSKNLTIGMAVEADTAAPLGRSKSRVLGRAAEVDTARPLLVGDGPTARGPVVVTANAHPSTTVHTRTTTARLEVSAR